MCGMPLEFGASTLSPDPSVNLLQEFSEVKNCVAACNKEGLMKHLEKQQKELEICEKALAEYMESKRRAFPRFYFVSSADLLDILSNGNNPIKVMQHMNKCFQVRQTSSGQLPCPIGSLSC